MTSKLTSITAGVMASLAVSCAPYHTIDSKFGLDGDGIPAAQDADPYHYGPRADPRTTYPPAKDSCTSDKNFFERMRSSRVYWRMPGELPQPPTFYELKERIESKTHRSPPIHDRKRE